MEDLEGPVQEKMEDQNSGKMKKEVAKIAPFWRKKVKFSPAPN
jgi:hypothetical protein